jgi:hypothetical protein
LRFKDPEDSTSGNVTTGRVSHPEQGKYNDPDEKGYAGPPHWGLGERPITIFLKKTLRPETLKDISDENRKQKTIWPKGTGCSTDPKNRMLEETI